MIVDRGVSRSFTFHPFLDKISYLLLIFYYERSFNGNNVLKYVTAVIRERFNWYNTKEFQMNEICT